MLKFVASFALVLSSFFICRTAISAEAGRPNVILIISDDQGFPDYGFMGSKIAKTPNLDRLAGESMLYTRGYTMPVCSPSLACLLTGQLPHKHGITGNDLTKEALEANKAKGKNDRSPLSQHLLGNWMILPRVLGEAGYLTFQTGKLWNVTAKEVGFTDGMTNKEGRHGGDGLTIGRESMKPIFDFITDAETRKMPYFVWYAPLLPHQPHNPPAALLAKYQNKGLSANGAKYFAMVEWFDQTIGELDVFLKKENRSENTIIVYLADNGWDPEQGNRAKLSPYERGIRTPIFVRWQGKVQPLRDDETLASIIDIVPTTLKACGLKVPSDLPGLDLLDRPSMTSRKSIFVESYTHDIAELDQPQKSLVAQVVISGKHKLILPGSIRPDRAFTSAPSEIELYDLRADPYEKENLAAKQSEEVSRLKGIQNGEWNAVSPSKK